MVVEKHAEKAGQKWGALTWRRQLARVRLDLIRGEKCPETNR